MRHRNLALMLCVFVLGILIYAGMVITPQQFSQDNITSGNYSYDDIRLKPPVIPPQPITQPDDNSLRIHTLYYDVKLVSGFIKSFLVNGTNILKNSEIETIYGLSMNEFAYGDHVGNMLYALQCNYRATYSVEARNNETTVKCIVADNNFYSVSFLFNNTFIFSNNTPTVEVFTTRIIDFSRTSHRTSANQICFIFDASSVDAYFDDVNFFYANTTIFTPNLDSSYAGYMLSGGINFTISIMESYRMRPGNCSFLGTSFGPSFMGYNEIQVTYHGLSDSTTPVRIGDILTESLHYTILFENETIG